MSTQENLYPGVDRFIKNIGEETGISFREAREGALEGLKGVPGALGQPGLAVPEALQALLGGLGMAFSPLSGVGKAIAREPVERQMGPAARGVGVAAGLLPEAALLGKAPLKIAAKGGPFIEKALRGLTQRTSKVPKVTGAKTFGKPSVTEAETSLGRTVPEEVAGRRVPVQQPTPTIDATDLFKKLLKDSKNADQALAEASAVTGYRQLPKSLQNFIASRLEGLNTIVKADPTTKFAGYYRPLEGILGLNPRTGGAAHVFEHEVKHLAQLLREREGFLPEGKIGAKEAKHPAAASATNILSRIGYPEEQIAGEIWALTPQQRRAQMVGTPKSAWTTRNTLSAENPEELEQALWDAAKNPEFRWLQEKTAEKFWPPDKLAKMQRYHTKLTTRGMESQ